MKTFRDHDMNDREYLAVQYTHSVSRKPRALAFLASLFLAVGPLSLLLLSQTGCSHSSNPFAKSHPLSPVELFQRASPSVFVVQSLDDNGKTLMLGSGVALAPDFLITNCHVVQSSSSLKVSRGEENWTAKLIAAAPNHDLCGLRPSGLTLQAVEVRASSNLATGEHVYAIGSPEGLELTFSEGVISALRDTEGVRMIQTSAPISPGSSGGGLFDAQGNLIGITTFQLKEGQSLNFALPGEWIKASHDDLIQASKKSSSRGSDAELESTAWLLIGQEAVKDENYDLAAHSFHKSADLKVGYSFQSSLELGKLLWNASWETSVAYRKWLCSLASGEAGCKMFGSPPEAMAREAETKAVSAFERAIELKPDCAEAWRGLAGLHLARKEYEQAISAAKEATRFAPGDWEAWMVLGNSYTETTSYAKAIDAFQRGKTAAPNNMKSSLLFRVGEAYAEEGDAEQVLQIYKELKVNDPGTAETLFRNYVLPPPKDPGLKGWSKRDRNVTRVLRYVQTTDDIRQAAWAAFHAAMNADDFQRRFDLIPLPNEIKHKLWDLKFGSQTTTGNPSPK
jgi:tetratricopeptide (TPR) repeat protein